MLVALRHEIFSDGVRNVDNNWISEMARAYGKSGLSIGDGFDEPILSGEGEVGGRSTPNSSISSCSD